MCIHIYIYIYISTLRCVPLRAHPCGSPPPESEVGKRKDRYNLVQLVTTPL